MEGLVAEIIWTYISPFLLVGGTMGNLMSFLVMRRTYVRTPGSTTFFLMALAIFDCLALWIGLLRQWVKHVYNVDLRSVHYIGCKLQRFGLYFTADVSAWILVGVTVERFVSICLPNHRGTFFTLSRSKLYLLALIVGMAVLNGHVLWARGRELVYGVNGTVVSVHECGYPSTSAKEFWEKVVPWMVLILYHAGPFTLMIVLNAVIIHRILSMRRRKALQSFGLQAGLTQLRDKLKVGLLVAKKAPAQTNTERRLHSLTKMFLTVTMLFLVLTAPSFVNFVLDTFGNWKRVFSSKGAHNLFEAIVLLLMYINHSINFVSYCLTGATFRQEFLSMVRPLCSCCVHIARAVRHDTQLSAGSTSKLNQRQPLRSSGTMLRNHCSTQKLDGTMVTDNILEPSQLVSDTLVISNTDKPVLNGQLKTIASQLSLDRCSDDSVAFENAALKSRRQRRPRGSITVQIIQNVIANSGLEDTQEIRDYVRTVVLVKETIV